MEKMIKELAIASQNSSEKGMEDGIEAVKSKYKDQIQSNAYLKEFLLSNDM
jgi:hypothetical protein